MDCFHNIPPEVWEKLIDDDTEYRRLSKEEIKKLNKKWKIDNMEEMIDKVNKLRKEVRNE